MNIKLTNSLGVLISAIRWRVKGGDGGTLPQSLDEAFTFRLAQYHNVLPWLWEYVNRFQLGSADFRTRLAKAVREERLRGAFRMKELAALADTLNQQAIPNLVFKGVAIEKMFYADRVPCRYSCDTDLLIRPKDFGEVSEILNTLGYVSCSSADLSHLSKVLLQNPDVYRWRDVGFKRSQGLQNNIDLHWRIADSFTLPIHAEELTSIAIQLDVDGHAIHSLPFSELFVYVCIHGHADYFFRLRYLVDLYCAMNQPGFDLERIMQLAELWGVKSTVERSIATVELFFDKGYKCDMGLEYSSLVMNRYIENNGFPIRSHPNKSVWKYSDKLKYLVHQIRYRSRKCAWYEPLLARFKYTEHSVADWSVDDVPITAYRKVIVNRLIRASGQRS